MKYYAVRIGRVPGIYHTWNECQAQIKGFSNACFKSFNQLSEAQTFIGLNDSLNQCRERASPDAPGQTIVEIYTDGSGLYPGTTRARAGSGVYIPSRNLKMSRRAPGFPQSNNRGELYAVILSLEWILKQEEDPAAQSAPTTCYHILTDSNYVLNGLHFQVQTHSDLWEQYRTLQDRLSSYQISIMKVLAHSGIHGNEVADQLAG